jgi:transcriptional regulator with XRE-family HTH domain
MTDVEIGRSLRALRVRRGLRQKDVAERAGVSQQLVSDIELGIFDSVTLTNLRKVAEAAGATIATSVKWQGADLARQLGAKHSAMHEALATMFTALPEWIRLPEVSFSIYGEHGVVDILAWHAPTRSLLVIEIKTELADLQTVGTLDRKVRLAATMVKDRGWAPSTVSAWLVIAEGSTNRDRVRAHRAFLRSALPSNGSALRAWLKAPNGQIHALSFLSAPADARTFAQVNRVRRRATPE